jgi:hypothetical protein
MFFLCFRGKYRAVQEFSAETARFLHFNTPALQSTAARTGRRNPA